MVHVYTVVVCVSEIQTMAYNKIHGAVTHKEIIGVFVIISVMLNLCLRIKNFESIVVHFVVCKHSLISYIL